MNFPHSSPRLKPGASCGDTGEAREEDHIELVSRITSLEDEVRALRRLVEQLVEKNS